MWPYKTYISYQAIFYPEADTDFYFKVRDELSELDLVSFVVNVYSRIHSHIDLGLVPSHNDFLREFIFKSKTTSVEETIDVFLKFQEEYFQMFCKNKFNVVQNYIYRETGIFKSSTFLHVKMPHNGGQLSNVYFAFTKLLEIFSKKTTLESKLLFIKICEELLKNDSFINRQYSCLNYWKIPSEIIIQEVKNHT